MNLQLLPVDFEKNILTTENKCSFCKKSICCNYITQQIDTPSSKKDYSHLLWQVSHKHIIIYKDNDSWNLLIEGKCMHLQSDGRCGIYETRPHICRKHSNDYCEFDAPLVDGFELYFPTYESLLTHCKKEFKNWDGKKIAKKSKKKDNKEKR